MSERDHFVLMAEYNAWMNTRLYDAAATLSAADLHADKGAFFGSIMGTLNHIMVADTIWLKRFATHPARFPALAPMRDVPMPAGLTSIVGDTLADLRAGRHKLDAIIGGWVAQLTDADLHVVFRYANTKGIVSDKRFASVLLHFFNHQTHHRGQATTLLSQAGIDMGSTDLLAIVPNEPC